MASEPEDQSESGDDASPAEQPDKDEPDDASRGMFLDLGVYG